MKNLAKKIGEGLIGLFLVFSTTAIPALASSHSEAPLISMDRFADNTDTYAFRSVEPGREGFVTLMANYIGLELPQGGPNYANFGENIRYEIHVKNNAATPADDITYRFTFTKISMFQ